MPITITYFALDTATSTGKAGDAANHTLYIKADDGADTLVAGTPAAGSVPGEYHVELSDAENDGTMMRLSGISSTANVNIVSTRWQNPAATVATGAFPIVVTVTDGAAPLENVIVRMAAGADVGYGTRDAATYTVTATLAGYTMAPTTHVVSASSGTHTLALVMTATVITPAVGATSTTAYTTILDENSDPVAGVEAKFVATEMLAGAAPGVTFITTPVIGISDVNGLVTVTLLRRCRYRLSLDGDSTGQDIDTDNDSVTIIPEQFISREDD
jgi:hypothetical protein